ncbi:hypothetical protein L6452_31130 [Arctium lappa]|uniref:Uncharacterized protein n=1 Tax=Arctium lappa TaxID=4217 RepID=A0ACB8ZL06_ARCLA|nr:hypothetical protein L6452_31130 [Arctium lappa]
MRCKAEDSSILNIKIELEFEFEFEFELVNGKICRLSLLLFSPSFSVCILTQNHRPSPIAGFLSSPSFFSIRTCYLLVRFLARFLFRNKSMTWGRRKKTNRGN